MVSVYNCDSFDEEKGTCRNYEDEPRPSFCVNTDVNLVPTKECILLKKKQI